MIGCCLPGKTPTEAALNQEFTVRADEPQKADLIYKLKTPIRLRGLKGPERSTYEGLQFSSVIYGIELS
jgi:hypothetical protein